MGFYIHFKHSISSVPGHQYLITQWSLPHAADWVFFNECADDGRVSHGLNGGFNLQPGTLALSEAVRGLGLAASF